MLTMPKRKGQQSEGKQASRADHGPYQYVLSSDHLEQGQLSDDLATSHFRCGCPKCHPEFWCVARHANGERCTLAGRPWPQAGNMVLCYRHMLEETGRRNLEELRSHKG